MKKDYAFKAVTGMIKQFLQATEFGDVNIPEEVIDCLCEIDRGYKESNVDALVEVVHVYETDGNTADRCVDAYKALDGWDYMSHSVKSKFAGICYSILAGVIILHGKNIPSARK